MKIDTSNFRHWINDEVTKEVFKVLKNVREDINTKLTNSHVLLGENKDTEVPRLIGQREGIDLILEVKCEDLEEEEHED